jgi:hypothetical protein
MNGESLPICGSMCEQLCVNVVNSNMVNDEVVSELSPLKYVDVTVDG